MLTTPTIRAARPEDLPAIRALARGHAPFDEAWLGKYEVLVLDDAHGGLSAAATFSIEDGRSHLWMLVVSPVHPDHDALERRMFGVIQAYCDAYGASMPDVPAHDAA